MWADIQSFGGEVLWLPRIGRRPDGERHRGCELKYSRVHTKSFGSLYFPGAALMCAMSSPAPTIGRIVDLTLTLRRGMRGVQVDPLHRIAKEGWNTSTLHLYSHC